MRTRVGKAFPPSSYATPSASPTSTKISGAFSILAGYDGPFDDICFTVNVFCGAHVQVRWDEDAGIGDSISSKGGGFSVKVRLAIDEAMCIRMANLSRRPMARSPPKMRAGTIRIRRICSTRNGTFVSMTSTPSWVGEVHSHRRRVQRGSRGVQRR